MITISSDIVKFKKRTSESRSNKITSSLIVSPCFQFNPLSPVSPNDPGYRSNPTLEEETFCLVNIMPADKVSMMNYNVIDKMLYIREVATSLSKAGYYRP